MSDARTCELTGAGGMGGGGDGGGKGGGGVGGGRTRVFSSRGKISAAGNLLLAVPHLVAGVSKVAIEIPQQDPQALAELAREKSEVACGTPEGDLAASVRAEVEGSDPYFCICADVEIPPASYHQAKPRRVGVLWDTSLSGGGA